MANEVNINISAHNLTGPGIASATGSMITFGNVITNISNKFGGASTAAKALTKSLDDNNKMIERGRQGFGIFGGVVTALTSHIKLFGGALDQIGLPKMISMVSGWHLLAEAIIETIAVWAPAAIAVAAFGLAATPVVIDLTKRMTSLYQSSVALNKAVYPLKGTFSDVSNAVKPEVYTLFGEGLIFASRSGDTFQKMAVGVGKVLEDLGARFVSATTSTGGVSKFADQATNDFKLIGDAVGNLGGIFGNVFKAVPGYAEILLKLGDSALHIIEVFTQAAEPVIAFGLAAHGAIIYLGLLGTVVAKVATSGLGAVANLALNAALGMTKFGAAGEKAAGGMLSFASKMESAAALPWGWIGIGIGAIVALGFALNNIHDAAQNFNDSMQKVVQNADINTLQKTLGTAIIATQVKAVQSTNDLTTAIKTQGPAIQGVAGHFEQNYNPALDKAAGLSIHYSQGLSTLIGQANLVNTRVSSLSKQYGSNAAAMALMNAAGITTAQITDKNNEHWAQSQIEIQAQNDALRAVTQTTGRLGAAQNALNFEANDSANALGTYQDTIQKLTKAEDDMINTLTGGESAFVNFQTNMQQMALDAGVSTGYLKQNQYTMKITGESMVLGTKSMDGLNAASLKLAGDFYSTVIPSAQKMVDALQAQKIGTSDLTEVVATEAGQMLELAGKSNAARVATVDFINNALGPGTVSFKSLNGWVDKNSTSLQGFKTIVDKTMASASKLAGVLQNDLNAMFAQDLLKVTGADKALQDYTKDLTTNTQDTAKGTSDRQKLIKDLENAGLSAKDAASYVAGLSKSVAGLKSKTIKVLLEPGGTGQIVITGSGTASGQGNVRFTTQAAGGGRIPGYAPGQDSHAGLMSPGEFVLVPEAARALGYGWLDAMNQGMGRGRGSMLGGGARYAGGGVGAMADSASWFEDDFGAKGVAASVQAALDNAKKSVQKSSSSSSGGPTSGDAKAAQTYAFGRFGQYGWGANQKAPLTSLWMQESGWNRFADNPSSDAYGIPQSLPFTKMPKAAWPARAGGSSAMGPQVNWGEDYIHSVYGTPAGAWSHEIANNWYGGGGPVFDSGGWLRPGWNNVFNGTGGPEHLAPTSGGSVQLVISSEGQSAFEAFMLKMMQNFVRVKGGGDVQKAFGGKK